MDYIDFLNQVKEEHTHLYYLLKKNDDRFLISHISHIEHLIEKLKLLARRAASLDDYRWVGDALMKWQVIVTNRLNEPIDTDIPPLSRLLSAPPFLEGRSFRSHKVQPLMGDEVAHLLRSLAEARAAHRKILSGQRSTPAEMKDDSETAKMFFALDVVSGKLNFARIGPESYPVLEHTWFKEATDLLAYLMWLDRLDDRLSGGPSDDYIRAISYIRGLLINLGIKAKPQEFETVRRYLEQHYLSNGILEHTTKENARELVRLKAQRIYNITGNGDEIDNWIEAETYTRLFYESIIPAALVFDKESTLKILKAFQSKSPEDHNRYIVTAFEATLAIYFLQPDVVKQLWDESATKPFPQGPIALPETVITSSVKVDSWPDDFLVPKSCLSMFLYTGSEILFRGVMSESQLDTLAKGLSTVQLDALRDLFERSRLIHQETTL